MPKTSFFLYYLTNSWGDKEVHTLPKGMIFIRSSTQSDLIWNPFIARTNARIHTQAWPSQIAWSIGIPNFGVPQAPSDNLNHTK